MQKNSLMLRLLITFFAALIFCTAFRMPNANSYGILLDQKEIYSSHANEKEVFRLSIREIKKSD